VAGGKQRRGLTDTRAEESKRLRVLRLSCRSRFQGQGRLEGGDDGSREERGDEGG
jgi:hypothetical protein